MRVEGNRGNAVGITTVQDKKDTVWKKNVTMGTYCSPQALCGEGTATAAGMEGMRHCRALESQRVKGKGVEGRSM